MTTTPHTADAVLDSRMLRRLRPLLPGRPGPALIATLGVVATVVAVVGLWGVVDADEMRAGLRAAGRDPGGLVLALTAFGLAFSLRGVAWSRTLPGLGIAQSVSAIHVALGANHLLPFRLGEPLRVISAVRRARVDVADAAASTVLLRTADMLSLLLIGLLAGPTLVAALLGPGGAVMASLLSVIGAIALLLVRRRRRAGSTMRHLGPFVLTLTTLAWLLEAVLVWQVLRWFDVTLSPGQALVVLAAAVGAQLIAIAPGGLGTYEAAAAAGMVAVGVPPVTAAAAALAMHVLKTLYSLVGLGIALAVPTPGLWGRLRLPRTRPARPPAVLPAADAPIVLFLPAHDEGPRVAGVIGRAPATVAGHPVEVVVVDDGSSDDTVTRARAAGATVITHDHNRGLGAAVRTGLAHASSRAAAAVAFCDADGEYDPAELHCLVGPILDGAADYVVGSRFAGTIHHMRPHRRLGNLALTAWVRWTVRQPVSDGQSGYRAFSSRAAAWAEVPHDYNYAQVLTIDLLAQGFVYGEVGIDYRFRDSGRSFIRLGQYLRQVVPTVWRQLNDPTVAT